MSVNKFRVGAAVVGVGLAMSAASVAGLAPAPEAGAAVEGVAIGTHAGYGSVAGRYGAGCTYKVAAMVSDHSPKAERVTITSRRLGGGPTVTLVSKKPTRPVVVASWTPSGPGVYVIKATQGTSTRSLTAQAGIGVQFPPFFGRGQCAVLIP